MNINNKHKTRNIGLQAERQARIYLESKGLEFIKANFSCRQGEIDLIMKDKEQIVFVEVKYRKNAIYGSGFEVVNKTKQKKLIVAAKHYLHKNQLTESISSRFDIISIDPNNTQWLQNAFT